jgi:sec-independent protein translocase protein TatB
MFEVGFTEIILIFGIALLVLGPARLPKLAADLGRWAGRARAMARTLRTQLEQEVQQLDPLATSTSSRPAGSAQPPPATPPAASQAPESADVVSAEPAPDAAATAVGMPAPATATTAEAAVVAPIDATPETASTTPRQDGP